MARGLSLDIGSWSGLTWRQLCGCWRCKIRYGGNPDVARAAALMELMGLEVGSREPGAGSQDAVTGEPLYRLRDGDGGLWTVTPRELSQAAKAALPWFDWPYGDRGDEAVKDEGGKVIKEARDGVRGYVNPGWRDAMMLQEETVDVARRPLPAALWRKRFALPQVACNNLTWQQYRSLQAITPQLFQEGLTEEQAIDLQAQFLAHSLVPRSLALLDTGGNSIRLRPHWEYTYDAAVYPLLFSDDGKKGRMQDALQGEVDTINAVMHHAGYTSQQEVYDSNLPFILGILNAMAKEAQQIEAMNARIKSKR